MSQIMARKKGVMWWSSNNIKDVNMVWPCQEKKHGKVPYRKNCCKFGHKFLCQETTKQTRSLRQKQQTKTVRIPKNPFLYQKAPTANWSDKTVQKNNLCLMWQNVLTLRTILSQYIKLTLLGSQGFRVSVGTSRMDSYRLLLMWSFNWSLSAALISRSTNASC